MTTMPLVARDQNPWRTSAAEVCTVTAETPGVATYHLRIDEADYFCRPGQFNMLYLPGVGESAISVSGQGADGTWLHTIRAAGNVTRSLEQLGIGGQLAVRGPFGTSWPLEDIRGRDVVLVAGGIGLAPLRPAIRWLLDHRAEYGRLSLIYGARAPANLLFQAEYSAWLQRGLHVLATVDRADSSWSGNIGVVTMLLDRLRPFLASKSAILACGPDVMMRFVVRSAQERGVGPDSIWLSLERNMQCAAGLCGHCQLGPAFVCKDGPVFPLDRIAPYLHVEAL